MTNGVVSAHTEKVVEFFLEREAAEAMIGDVREDEPLLAENPRRGGCGRRLLTEFRLVVAPGRASAREAPAGRGSRSRSPTRHSNLASSGSSARALVDFRPPPH